MPRNQSETPNFKRLVEQFWVGDMRLEDYVWDKVIDRADTDERIAKFREAAIADGWVVIAVTLPSASGDGPSIVHRPSMFGDKWLNDSSYDNWEYLVWECGLMDIPKPDLKKLTPDLTLPDGC